MTKLLADPGFPNFVLPLKMALEQVLIIPYRARIADLENICLNSHE